MLVFGCARLSAWDAVAASAAYQEGTFMGAASSGV